MFLTNKRSGNHANYVGRRKVSESVVSFSGIGGLDLAAEWAGIETVAFCENADFPKKILMKQWPTVPQFEDVKQLNIKTLESSGIDARTIGIIHGGFPCQPFSLAGKGKAENDDRYLWHEFARLVKEIRPRWVVGENVPGILNRGLETTVSDLEKEGYEVWVFSVAASDIGAIHKDKGSLSLLATPTASQSYKRIRPLAPSEANGKHGKVLPGSLGENFESYIGKYPNLAFVEWMMGYPENWTKTD